MISVNTLLVAAIVVVALGALVIVGVALWDLGRDWWTPGERGIVRVREHDDLRPKR